MKISRQKPNTANIETAATAADMPKSISRLSMGQIYLKATLITLALLAFAVPSFILKKLNMLGDGAKNEHDVEQRDVHHREHVVVCEYFYERYAEKSAVGEQFCCSCVNPH